MSRSLSISRNIDHISSSRHSSRNHYEHKTLRDPKQGMKYLSVLPQSCRDASQMPKGGLLHAHLDATVRADVLLGLAMKQPAIHVRASRHLSAGTFKTVLPEFRALPQAQWTQRSSITDPSYEPNAWVPIQNARNNFSDALGGPAGFDRWVIGALMIEPAEAYGTHNSTAKVNLPR